MDVKKYGIIYLLVGLVVVMFIITKLFPGQTLFTIMQGVGVRTTPGPLSSNAANGITVTIDYGNGVTKSYPGISASNAYLALIEAAQTDKLAVKTNIVDQEVVVQGVGDITTTDTKTWHFYINDKSGVNPDKTAVTTGDNLVWKFEAKSL